MILPALQFEASTILLFHDRPPLAGTAVSTTGWGYEKDKPYIAMILDGGETSDKKVEWGESVRRFFHQIGG